jgi:hypothetical protein
MPQNTAETLKDADGVNPVVETQESLEKKSDSSEIILEAQTDLISTQKENSDIMSQGLET